ncbi:hypothetical protein E2C01_039884 [Portunus trituberculatus]|uniref:DUF7041 domain-containing protein n=1 Tax=Portunus trituberculatus TaxID=210409 RepID=A0A5B7FP85_PORTR|nr:hypothetical protein [Portunus trituberculatus]
MGTKSCNHSGTAMAIAFRVPPFCSQDPSLWFSLLECSFKASKITSSLTKFNYAVSQLPSDVLPQVSAVISTAATADNPYEELKTVLLKSLQSSIATRFCELLSKEELVPPHSLPRKTFMSQDLTDCSHVFICVDAVHRPFMQPYQGPYHVLRCTRKTVTVDRNSSTDAVSEDRVKPAYFLEPNTTAVLVATNTHKSKASTRRIRFSLPCH